MMEYKGYIGTAAYDARTKLFHGDIVNTRDVITFQGTTVQEIEKAFRDSIHDYLIQSPYFKTHSENILLKSFENLFSSSRIIDFVVLWQSLNFVISNDTVEARVPTTIKDTV